MYEPIEWSQGSENSDQDFGLKVSAVHMTTSIFTRELANKKTCAPIWPPGWVLESRRRTMAVSTG